MLRYFIFCLIAWKTSNIRS